MEKITFADNEVSMKKIFEVIDSRQDKCEKEI
jgi:hypothetical protein